MRSILYSATVCVFAVTMARLPALAQAGADTESVAAIVKSNTRFGFELLRTLKPERANAFVSPFSVSTALAPLYAGARGDTARQFAKVLGFPRDHTALHDSYRSLLGSVRAGVDGEKSVLRIAAGMWVQTGKDLLPEFERVASEDYELRVERADFRNRAASIVEDVNAWVARETNDKIQNLMSRDGVDALTRLVLVNAVYFKGRWQQRFDPRRTSTAEFWISERESVAVPTMSQQNRFMIFENELLTLLQLPYAGERVSMLLLLPRTHAGMAELMESLTQENLAAWEEQARSKQLTLRMPRFRVSSKVDLASVLKTMGLAAPFGDAADFSGVDGTRDLRISSALHQAFVEVDEEGSEAAAATGVAIGIRSVVPVPVVDFNRPFVFLIRENASATILFLGRLNNPLA